MAITDKVRITTIPHGCTSLTAANVQAVTPAYIESLGMREDVNKVLASMAEARAVGVVAKPMWELLQGRITEIGKDKLNQRSVRSTSLVLPFSYRDRRTNIGQEYFNITAGIVSPNAGSTVGGISYPTSSWALTVGVNTATPVNFNSALDNVSRQFLPGEYIYVENVNAAGTLGVDRSRRVISLKVINSVHVSAGVATITVAAPFTTSAWAALTAGQKAPYQPTFGVVTIGTNAVGDYESWCNNQAATTSHSLLVDWHQTSRYTQCSNDEYERILSEILDGNLNPYAKSFAGYESLAEQNKKAFQLYQQKWAHDIFYGQPIDETQNSPENYATLPPIVDVEDGTVYGYKAKALGLRTLLANESRVIDMQGAALNLDNLLKESYMVHRVRKESGEDASCIDWMTDKDTATLLHVTLVKHLKDTYQFTTTQFFESGKVVDATTGLKKFSYVRYQIPGMPFDVAVFVEDFFTDRMTNFLNGSGTNGQGAVNFLESGRSIFVVDWSDFNLGIVATNSAKREYKGKVTADANSLYSCVIAMNTKRYDLRSTTWTTQLGDAKRHVIFENFTLGAMTLPDLNPYA